ncbi:MAG: SDR family NAD(P)-dependent oxidoreductase, partial [Sphingobacteriia bacterium]
MKTERKTVVITGISRGIGRAIAQRFQQAGYHLVGCARTADSIRAFQEDFPLAEVQAVDLADKAAVQAFGHWVVQQHKVEVLVNNAGSFVPGGMLSEADQVYEQLMRVNVDSVYYLSKILAAQMRGLGQGTIINLCSVASIKAYAAGGSYAISKHALLGLSRAMREELKPDGVRVCSILPGATLTDSWAGAELPETRFIQPESVAELV